MSRTIIKDYYREGVPLPLFTEIPRRVLLGNPKMLRYEKGRGSND